MQLGGELVIRLLQRLVVALDELKAGERVVGQDVGELVHSAHQRVDVPAVLSRPLLERPLRRRLRTLARPLRRLVVLRTLAHQIDGASPLPPERRRWDRMIRRLASTAPLGCAVAASSLGSGGGGDARAGSLGCGDRAALSLKLDLR
eukprot:7377940-Prymnesium_polylepis.1